MGLSVATAALGASVMLLGVAMGWSWPDAATVAAGGVGTWSLANSTVRLRQVLAACSAPLCKASPAVPAVALGLSVAAAGVARMVGGPPVVMLGGVDVVVANLVVAATAAFEGRP